MDDDPKTSERAASLRELSPSPTIKRVGWGLLVGTMIAILPWLAVKLNSVAILLVGEVLGWPGALVALVFGGWNSRPMTVFLCYSVNLVLYVALTYFFLSRRERRMRLKKLDQKDSRF